MKIKIKQRVFKTLQKMSSPKLKEQKKKKDFRPGVKGHPLEMYRDGNL